MQLLDPLQIDDGNDADQQVDVLRDVRIALLVAAVHPS